MEMNPNIIEDLPEELMIEIFGYLSPKLLKTAALVCKRWNEIISNSPKTLKHYQLNLVSRPRDKILDVVLIGRKLSALKTNVLTEPVVDFMKLQLLKHLELTKLTTTKQKLADILALVAKSTSLVFDEVKLETSSRYAFDSEPEIKVQPVEFPNLKQVRFCESDTRIFSLIKATSVIEFSSLRWLARKRMTPDEVDFLAQQKFLRSLTLKNAIDDYFLMKMSSFKFKLQKLVILDDREGIDREFIKQQKDSLEEVHIRGPIYLSDMPNLKSLTAKRLYLDPNIVSVGKLEHLSAEFLPENQKVYKRFFELTENLKSYENKLRRIRYDSFLADLGRLESLTIQENTCFNSRTVVANLKEIKFVRIWRNEKFFNIIIRNHSQTLEKLSIDMLDGNSFPSKASLEAIRSCKNLKLLSVSCMSSWTTKILGKIEFDHQWTLEVLYKKFRSTPLRNFVHEPKWTKVVFHFPDDARLFNGENSWDEDVLRHLANEAMKQQKKFEKNKLRFM